MTPLGHLLVSLKRRDMPDGSPCWCVSLEPSHEGWVHGLGCVEARAVCAGEDEATSLRATFDLRWKADMRAIKRWQEAHPDRAEVWPDHADMVVWLMEQLSVFDTLVEVWNSDANDPILTCDVCHGREWSDDLTPDWNPETGNHRSCEEQWAALTDDPGMRGEEMDGFNMTPRNADGTVMDP